MTKRLAILIGLVAQGVSRVVGEDDSAGTCAAGDSTCDVRAAALLQKTRRAKVSQHTHKEDKKLQKPRVSLAGSKHSREEDSPYAACYENAEKAFDEVLAMDLGGHLGHDLTDLEKEAFKTRFVEELQYSCKHDEDEEAAGPDGATATPTNWAEDIVRAMEDTKPAFTAKLAEFINGEDRGYTVEAKDWMAHESQRSYDYRLGKKGSPEAATMMAQTKEKKASKDQKQAPDAFDSRDEWPACADVINKIHNQGDCGSCWAFAALSATDSRLCIATEGGFTKELSRTYLTSCAFEYGCNGGLARYAYAFLATGGVPTGGANGCSPEGSSDEGRDHFDIEYTTPPCPLQCGNAAYGRSISEDKFMIPGMGSYTEIWPTTEQGNNDAKLAMMSGGPLSFGMYAPRVFLGYSSGIFNSGCGSEPNHEVLAVGWGADHFVAMNSWGEHWGDSGTFKVAECVVHDWTIPGDIGDTESLPVLLESQPAPASLASQNSTQQPSWDVTGPCDRECADLPNGGRRCCVTSPRYYSHGRYYMSECTIGVGFGTIEVEDFQTEAGRYSSRWGRDYMTVNGQEYDGTNSPHGVTPTSAIEWKADC